MANTKKTNKEPLFHIVKRDNMSWPKRLLIYAIAIIIGFLITSVFCAVSNEKGKGVWDMFISVYKGSFGTERKIWIFLQELALLLGVSLAILPSFKMKFWNLGANGQVLISCLACYACMYYGDKAGASPNFIIPLMIICSISAGVIWAVIPAIFKALFKTNESLFTLMMNYLAVGLVSVFITIWFPKGSGSVKPINTIVLPDIYKKQVLTLIVVSVLTVFMTLYLKMSKQGFEVSLVGESENTARYVGINVKKVVIRTLILSGIICGIIGLLLVGSINHSVNENMANNRGFTAIMTAWLAKFNPLAMILTCGLITFISNGMSQVRMDFGFYNNALSNIILGVIYFFIIGCDFFITYKIVFRKKAKKQKKEVN
ncbi:MAG: ABC transporter permease [Clostridia bacterium]|nr:ABC transporter permease [Clostridia bacterium]MBR2968489.1 ABC transporter permease [Clostridia bacterium]